MKTAAVALALALTSACASYVGGGAPISPAQVDTRVGWITAAPTPTVKQRNLADCGAAALAMMAGRWRLVLSLDDAARSLPPPTRKGVRLSDLRDAARKHGLVAFAVAADQAVLEHELGAGRPVIVGLLRPYSRNRASSHFEVVVALRQPDSSKPEDKGEIVTIDPGSGWMVRRWSAFETEWKLAGRPALVVIGTRD